jgi:hypothetical protein
MPKPSGWQHSGQRGNTDDVAIGTNRGSGGLSPRHALRRGLPQRQPATQADRGDDHRGARDQARPRRGSARSSPRADAARLRGRMGRSLRRHRARRRAREHPPRIPAAARAFALAYFDRGVHVRDLDRAALQRFTDWPTSRPGRNGRLCDRSIANALTPLRMALDAAVAECLLEQNPAAAVVLPRRRGGRAWDVKERAF